MSDSEVCRFNWLSNAHRTTMKQNQRKELVRVLSMAFEGEKPAYTLEQIASMTDRQVSLSWLHICEYITEDQYRREFDVCVGPELFPTKQPSKDLCHATPHQKEPPVAG